MTYQKATQNPTKKALTEYYCKIGLHNTAFSMTFFGRILGCFFGRLLNRHPEGPDRKKVHEKQLS